jgi:hypothetical protein
MIDTIIFFLIGIFVIYTCYKLIKKEVDEGKCANCQYAKHCKNKERVKCKK